MVETVSLTAEFAIGPQVASEDFPALRAAGFAAVLNARPDDEDGAYLAAAEAEQLARDNGLAYVHSPTENHAIFEPDHIDRFEQALADLPGPIFAHCKSGTRAAILWALVAVRHRPVEVVIATLRAAGQDLDFLEQEMRDSAAEAVKSPLRLREDALLSLSRSSLLGGGTGAR
ncbi:MAG: TIGR01244 family phosphatase [Rhizobiales bacterium]|nr:TIGR01244 family phosphatase [Hyphomicrobiales bacterium]